MAAAAVQSAVAKMFKTVFKGRNLENFSFRKCALGDKINATPDLVGASLTFPVNWGLNWGISPTLTATVPAAKAGVFDNWVIPSDTPSKLYGRLTIDIPSMMRAIDVGAFMQMKAKHVAELIGNMKMMRRGKQLWSDGAGDLGKILSVTGSNPVTAITLTSYEDGVNFDGSSRQIISFSQTRTGGVLRSDAAGPVIIKYQVDKVSRFNASGACVLSVTRTQGAAAASDPLVNDFIYNDAQYDTGPKGIPAWLPASEPSATLFFGVDRSREPEMFAGWRGTWEGTINDSIQRTVSLMTGYLDPQFSNVWVSPVRWYQLKEELESMGRFYIDQQKELEFGTGAIRLHTPSGSVTVMADLYCPNDRGFLLKHDEIHIHSTGELIHMCDEDVPGLRLPDDDGLEYRWRSLAQYRIDTPWRCGSFPITQAIS